jgi:small subunit ribosomal protein S9
VTENEHTPDEAPQPTEGTTPAATTPEAPTPEAPKPEAATPEAPSTPQVPTPMPGASETPAAPPAVATQPAPAPTPSRPKGPLWGVGRRKTAVARVRLIPGSGKLEINKKDVNTYFTQPRDQSDVVAPLELAGVRSQFDVLVNVRGGGPTGQAGAVRLGLARALVKAYADKEADLRDAGYLTRDARKVERKKPGRRKARRRFQFSKR